MVRIDSRGDEMKVLVWIIKKIDSWEYNKRIENHIDEMCDALAKLYDC